MPHLSAQPPQRSSPAADSTVVSFEVDRDPQIVDVHDHHRPVDDHCPQAFRAGTRPALPRVSLFGLDMISAPSLDPVVASILAGAPCDEGRLPLVLTPNVDIIVHLEKNQDQVEADLFRRAQYCLPDGQPIVVASKLLGRPVQARLTGSDLFAQLWPRIVVEQIPVVVVASSSEIAGNLADEVPSAEFVVPPFFDADDLQTIDDVSGRVLEAIGRVSPRLVLIGIGNPKDARIIGRVLERWDPADGAPPLILALGASFALYLRLITRAPVWMQRRGLEWFHRFLQEPRRLFGRYFIRDVAFLPIVWREWRQGRSAR